MGESVGIALFGCGVVGTGVLRLLTEQRKLFKQRTGLTFDVRHVVCRDPAKYPALAAHYPLHTGADAALADPAVKIVVELIGGIEPAAAYLARALEAGKHVVTANKSVLAAQGPRLFAKARNHHAAVAFEASCGGGIPIIDALSRGLLANRIDALVGIVNGTCNFILTQMTQAGHSYAAALAEAQRLGFAEADPTLDVSGRDTAQKLAVLAGLAFDAVVTENDIHIEGIDTLRPNDIAYARELGYVIKLLAIAERNDRDRLSLRVHPTLVATTDPLAGVSGSFNAISVYGHATGHQLFYGRGAGGMPTASAVVADLLAVAVGTLPLAFERLSIFAGTAAAADVLPFEQLHCRYYLRVNGRDIPGVMARITDALGRHGISLSAVLQRDPGEDNDFVPIVITTHKAREGSIRAALTEIDALEFVKRPTICLRIIDQPKEFAVEAE